MIEQRPIRLRPIESQRPRDWAVNRRVDVGASGGFDAAVVVLLLSLLDRLARDRADREGHDASTREPVGAVTPACGVRLSARQRDVMRLVTQGLTNAKVAEALCISPRTVERHLETIYNKLGVSSRNALTHYALTRGID